MPIMDGVETGTQLIRLIDECVSFSITTAWATPSPIFEAIKKNINKLKIAIVGIDFYQTHPAVLEWLLIKAPKKTLIGKSKKGVFHPKLYCFDLGDGDNRTIMIGSANMTAAAFTSNEERCIRVKMTKISVDNTFDKLNKISTSISDFDIVEYKKKWLTHGALIRLLARDGSGKSSQQQFLRYPDVLDLDFDEYHWLCTQEMHHYYQDRIDMLGFAINTVQSGQLSHNDFCCLAGIPPNTPATNLPKCGFFGSMRGNASFRDTVKAANSRGKLMSALGLIPRTGNVTSSEYKTFLNSVNNIVQVAYGNSYGKAIHLSPATRLLSMWRPDLFFCVNGAVVRGLAYDLNTSAKGKFGIQTTDGYWDTVQRLQNSTWGKSSNNKKWAPEKETCWKGRIAMIDSLYYEPI